MVQYSKVVQLHGMIILPNLLGDFSQKQKEEINEDNCVNFAPSYFVDVILFLRYVCVSLVMG